MGLENKINPLTELHTQKQFVPYMGSYLFGTIVQLQQVVADVGLKDRVPLFAGLGACQPLKGTNTVATKQGEA